MVFDHPNPEYHVNQHSFGDFSNNIDVVDTGDKGFHSFYTGFEIDKLQLICK